MPFPFASIVDNFNRTNEGPPPSSSWSSIAGISGVKVISNECGADGTGICGSTYNTSYNANAECAVIIKTKPGTSEGISVGVRVKDIATGVDGYTVNALQNSGTDDIRIRRVDNGVATTLSTVSQEYSVGDGIGIQMIGDVIYAWYYNGSTWSSIDNYDTSGDATRYTAGG